MPCDETCERTVDFNFTRSNLIEPDPIYHFANMGWVGFMKLKVADFNNILRVTSANVNLKQEITKPDVIDGRIDPTVYQLGPKLIDGTFSMPLVADNRTGGCPQDITTEASTLLNSIWCWVTARGEQGRLLWSDAELEIRYANHAAYKFSRAIPNTFSLSVVQGDMIKVDIEVYGTNRSRYNDVESSPLITDFLAPARVLTWNDITINGIGGCSRPDILFYSNQVREFKFDINNHAERFLTMNGSLYPMDVNVGKREITGSLKLLGLQDRLREVAETNQNFFTEKNEIRMAMYVGNDTFDPTTSTTTPRDWTADSAPAGNIFAKKLTGVVFQIEEIEMTNSVLETTVNWHAMADDTEEYEAISPSTSCSFPAWEV